MKWHILVVGLLAACSLASGADVELPAAAKKTLLDKYKDAAITEVKKETKDGKVKYEVEFKDAAGAEREMEVTAEGEIVSEAREIKPADLPKAVTDALAKAYPAATIKEAKVETEKGVESYEVELKTKDGEVDVEISADGSKMKAEKGGGGKDDDKDEKK